MALHAGSGSGGAAAPTTASYLTLGTDSTLTSERVLTAGTGVSFVDGGAGSTLTISSSAAAGTDSTAWHNTPDSFGSLKAIGTGDAQPFVIKTNGSERLRVLSTGELLMGRTTLAVAGDIFEFESAVNGRQVFSLRNTSNGATTDTAFSITHDSGAQASFSLYGSGETPANMAQIDVQGHSEMRMANLSSAPWTWVAASTEVVRLLYSGALLLNRTAQVSDERFCNIGKTYFGGDITCVAGTMYSTDGSAPAISMNLRRDAADTATALFLDNRNAGGGTILRMGNNPGGTSAALTLYYDNGTGATQVNHSSTGTFTIGTTSNIGFILRANNVTKMTMDGTGIGFYAHATVAQQTPTGSRGSNAALASLLTALANLGLIVDGTS